MKKAISKPISLLLSILMVLSMFGGLTLIANAAEPETAPDVISRRSITFFLVILQFHFLSGMIVSENALIFWIGRGNENPYAKKETAEIMESKDLNMNIGEYAAQAKARWGETQAYAEYEKKTAGLSGEEMNKAGGGLMRVFEVFGSLKDKKPSDPEVQSQVKALKEYITSHFYTCTNAVLSGLGKMYAAGGEFTENIDRAGGAGTAAFTAEAIENFCKK